MTEIMDPKVLLAKLTPETIRGVGKEYGIKLTGKTDTLPNEWVFLIMLAAAVIASAVTIGFDLLPNIPLFRNLFAQVLMVIAICALPFLFSTYFLQFVPKYTLLQGQNIFTGRLHAYSPGLRLKAPWYWISSSTDYIDTRLIVMEGATVFITKDGVPITYQWTTQGRIHAPLLGLNTRVGLEDMAKSVADVIENVFQKEFLNEPATVLRSRETVKKIEERLIAALNAPLPEWVEGEPQVTLDYERNPVWVRFGIVFELITLGAPKFSDDYTQALTSDAIAEMIKNTAKKFQAENGASPDVALNTSLIINKENVKRDVVAFEGLDKVFNRVAITMLRILRKKE